MRSVQLFILIPIYLLAICIVLIGLCLKTVFIATRKVFFTQKPEMIEMRELDERLFQPILDKN
mgnify:CR=1 FL=1